MPKYHKNESRPEYRVETRAATSDGGSSYRRLPAIVGLLAAVDLFDGGNNAVIGHLQGRDRIGPLVKHR